jgi:hypothetical protein
MREDKVKKLAILLRHFDHPISREYMEEYALEDLNSSIQPDYFEFKEAMDTWENTENKESYILRAEELILLDI